jgi:hypothetical protein
VARRLRLARARGLTHMPIASEVAVVSGELAASLAAPPPVSTILELPPGLHAGVPEDVYHQRVLGVASKHALDLVLRAPAVYRAWIDGLLDDADRPALAFGRALHCAVLEPERFDREYAVEPPWGDCRKTANRERRDGWRAEHAGKTFLPADDGARIRSMRTAVREHPAGPFFVEGVPEVTLRWEDEDTGLVCKARADWWDRRTRRAIDVKTTDDARPFAFARAIEVFGYHVQDGFYTEGFEALGEPIHSFLFVVVEKAPPFLVRCYELDAEDVRAGRAKAREGLRTLADCIAHDDWPGYPEDIQTISRPRWARETT